MLFSNYIKKPSKRINREINERSAKIPIVSSSRIGNELRVSTENVTFEITFECRLVVAMRTRKGFLAGVRPHVSGGIGARLKFLGTQVAGMDRRETPDPDGVRGTCRTQFVVVISEVWRSHL